MSQPNQAEKTGARRAAGSFAAIRGHPIHPMLVPLPIGAFTLLVLTDLAFVFTGDAFWARASFWLIVAGVIGGVLAAAAGIADYAKVSAARNRFGHMHAAGNTIVLILGALNWSLRVGDPVLSVLPWGILLSLVTIVILGAAGWAGGELIYKYRVGVQPSNET